MSTHESKICVARKVNGETLRVKGSKTHDIYIFLEISFKYLPDIDYLLLLS